MINVTKSHLPDINKFKAYVDKIYESAWLTNSGPLNQELEKRLASHLGVKNILLVANGTLALHIAYRALGLKGEVITTPFSFAATSSSLVWEGLKSVYADICPNSFNISPANIEKSITEKTSAIVPVHVFGNACLVDEISVLAKKYRLKVIYDAAHAFDVASDGNSLLNQGDISTLSFHATKLFHTIEGGALIVNDDELCSKIRGMINFGIDSNGSISPLGINAKMNEFQAAMGLCMLDEVKQVIESRQRLVAQYRKLLDGWVRLQKFHPEFSQNYAYFPVVFHSHKEMLAVKSALIQKEIDPRRYFLPSLDKVYGDGQIMEVSRDLVSRVLCLPLSAELKCEDVTRIVVIVKQALEVIR